MHNYLLTLKFIGTNFVGWQVQKNGVSVCETVQDAIEKVIGERGKLTGCSRTDSGVHALKYCANLLCDREIEPQTLMRALNFYLPQTVSVTGCKKVSLDFHARYHAIAKTYTYRIYTADFREPFLEGYALHKPGAKFDLARLNSAASGFVGTHNFKAFCSAGGNTGENTLRTVLSCGFSTSSIGCDYFNFKITANGFLYNMVRIIVGTLLEINDRGLPSETICDIIQSQNRAHAGFTAPPYGLFLTDIQY
jgi:tRNA pseudouridine38-40 synthase